MEERQEQLKPSKKLMGMAVYSVQEGQNLGQVKNLVIDAKEKRLLAMVVEKKRLTREDKLLPFAAVKSVGDDVVTVERGQALERRGMDASVMRALRRPVQPLGARCFTAGGKTAGKVEEYYFDVGDGSIAQLEISGVGLLTGKLLVDGRHIIALAPHTIMLDDEALLSSRPQENGLLSSMELARDKAANTARNTVSLLGNSISKIRGVVKESVEEAPAPEEVPAEAVVEEEAAPEEVPAGAVAVKEAVAEAAPEPTKTSLIAVAVLTPEEAHQATDSGLPVNAELQDILQVKEEPSTINDQ